MSVHIIVLLIFFIPLFTQAQNLATISYSGTKGPITINITLKEFQKTYRAIKQIAPNTPPAKQFFQEYLRYRVGLEHAYNEPSLVKSSNIRNMFADPLLKEGFEQLLYKSLAEKKLKKTIAKADRTARKLSKNVMLKFYRNNPEFDINFITINLPDNPNATQIKETKARATKIYNEVKKSKKAFTDLVDIYSDDRLSGKINIPRSRHTIYPTIYKQLKKMKNGQISTPIRTATGLYIIKLNRKVPFGEANRTQIKAAYFDQKRSQALNKYFDGLKSKYKVRTNTALLNKIR